MLHVTNGDAAAGSLRAAGLEGEVTIWADVLHEGPVRAGLDQEQMLEERARHLAERWDTTFDEALAAPRRWDQRIEEAIRAGDPVVLWFEHDLFDQLILVRLLDRFGFGHPGRSASLICIDRFPGVVPFHGLGQLSPTQLASLFPARRPVTASQAALASRAWKAFTASDPSELAALVDGDTSALPFLSHALGRLLEEYPSVENGLGRTERTSLAILAGAAPFEPRDDAGGVTARQLFRAQQRTEEAPFLGDLPFFAMLGRMARERRPPIALDPPMDSRATPEATGARRVTLTPFGRDLLEGRADAVRANGIDRWIGGVHLAGDGPAWRWDGRRRTLVRA